MSTRRPVVVDDVTRSPVFTGHTLEPVLHAGSRAVASHPPVAGGALLGVLSFHYPAPHPARQVAGLISRSAADALAQLALPRPAGAGPGRPSRSVFLIDEPYPRPP